MVVYPSWAVTRVFFTSQESVETELVNLINESHSTIDLALFRFASQPLALAIRRARDRHVRLRLVLDGHPEAEGKTNTVGLAFVAGEVRRLDGKRGGSRGIMHHKFVLFDQARVVTGSFNWTAGAEHVNYENALLIDDSSVVTSYSQEFERLWERAQDVDPGSMDVAASRFEESKIMAPGPAFPTYFSQSFSRKKRHHRRARKSRCW
jgi:phosphatidylserine/phosphatidylglycerophosphate/cardiolipin synthase-like enzyme